MRRDDTNRPTGRRLGRIIGQLDDIVTLLRTYYGVEEYGENLHYNLVTAASAVDEAIEAVEKAAAIVNARGK